MGGTERSPEVEEWLVASVGNRERRSETERSRGLRASANRAPPHGGEGAEALFPLRVTTTAADPKRDCASSKPKQRSVGPSKYELQGPTV
jgi:hypothetical protein